MANTTATVERRKHKRYRVENGAFAVLRPDNVKLGQISEIGMDGLSFRYIAQQEPPGRSHKLDILLSSTDFHLQKVPFGTILYSEIRENPSSVIKIRQCTVQFGELTDNQKVLLQYFIQNHTTGEVV